LKFESKAVLTEWARHANHLYFFLDYDGTLADFAPNPDVIEPNPRIINLIKQLSSQTNYRIVILSGRTLEHISRLLPVNGIFLAGTYGIELRTPDGKVIQRAAFDEIRPVLETIKPRWESVLATRKGFYLEDKGWTLAIHARFADTNEVEKVIKQAREALDDKTLAGHFRILEGHRFLEIAPLLASKKETVSYLLTHYPLPDANLLYIGDDDKDEEAFPIIHSHRGMAIKVFQPSQTSRPTEADFFFDSPFETLDWLEGLLLSFTNQ
jgi:trehalose 6-phosphate phosphatase